MTSASLACVSDLSKPAASRYYQFRVYCIYVVIVEGSVDGLPKIGTYKLLSWALCDDIALYPTM